MVRVLIVDKEKSTSMKSQCQLTTHQPSAFGTPSVATGTTVVNGVTGNHLTMTTDRPDITRRGAAEEADSTLTLVNPWRELDRNAFVIAYAVKGTARCGACLSKVAQGELQVSRGKNCQLHVVGIPYLKV